MNLRKVVAFLSAGYILLNNVCLTDMVSAMDTHTEEDEFVMEMNMTPITPMSYADCHGCVMIKKQSSHHPTSNGMPCGMGEMCLTEHSQTQAAFKQTSEPHPQNAKTESFAWNQRDLDTNPPPASEAEEITQTYTDSIVFRE